MVPMDMRSVMWNIEFVENRKCEISFALLNKKSNVAQAFKKNPVMTTYHDEANRPVMSHKM